jgi:hypothetical protein
MDPQKEVVSPNYENGQIKGNWLLDLNFYGNSM